MVLFLQKIEEAAERGELNELVLMVIWNRLDLARRDVCFHLSMQYHLDFNRFEIVALSANCRTCLWSLYRNFSVFITEWTI